MEQASGHHIVGGMGGCDPLSVGSGGRLEGGGWFTREHWKGVAGSEFPFAEESSPDWLLWGGFY